MFALVFKALSRPLPGATRRRGARPRRRFVRFGLVGLSGVGVKTGTLWVLVSILDANPFVGALISTEISILTNFALNDHWTFRDARSSAPYARRAANYHAVTLTGAVASIAIFAGLTQWLGMQYMLSNLIAIGAGTLSNYVLSLRFAWSVKIKSPVPTLAAVPEVSE